MHQLCIVWELLHYHIGVNILTHYYDSNCRDVFFISFMNFLHWTLLMATSNCHFRFVTKDLMLVILRRQRIILELKLNCSDSELLVLCLSLTRNPCSRRPTAHLPIDVGEGSQVNFFLKFEQVHVLGEDHWPCLHSAPPPWTDKTENITFLQTTYAGGNDDVKEDMPGSWSWKRAVL